MQLALLMEARASTTSGATSKETRGRGNRVVKASPAAAATLPETTAKISSNAAKDTGPCSDEMLHMRELVRVTKRHRTTIYRYIKLKLFPQQRTRNGKKIGWARSDVDRWMEGDPVLDD